MADDKKTEDAQSLAFAVGQTVITTEEQALSVYYQMRSYPELQSLLNQHSQEITKAIQSGDANTLIGILQKVQSDFLRSTAEQPYQMQLDTERKIKEAQPTPEEISILVDNTKQALGESYKTAESVYTTKHKKNQEFIEKLVKNYSKLPPNETSSLTSAIIATAETYPEITPQEVIQRAGKTIPTITPEVIQNLQQHKNITSQITTAQKNDVTVTEQQIIRAILESPEPITTVRAIQELRENEKFNTVQDLIKKSQVLAQADALTQNIQDPSTIDYRGFFTNISKNGTAAEKLLSPLADAVFSILPKNTQEKIVFRVIGTAWTKEVSDNTFLQKTLGPIFQSTPIQNAIQKGNQLFSPSGQKNAVFSQTNTFVTDIFVTVFHPQVSEVYLQLAQLNKMQMSQSMEHFYLGLLADRGVTYAAKKGAATAGKAIAAKAGSKVAGDAIGALAGGATANPIVGFFASLVGDKIIGGVWRGIKRGFSLISGAALSNIIAGNYNSTPLTKDPLFLFCAAVVVAVALLFVIPITPFTLGGSASFQQTVQDNAYIQGIGTGGETGPAIDCAAEPNNPLCSMKSCDTSKQDCRWPTSGTITQGPYTKCGGTHSKANAIDIAGTSGVDVYATIDGAVDNVFTHCPDNVGFLGNTCGNYFGNWVQISGTCNNGTTSFHCTLMFGHLRAASIKLIQGQAVNKTTVIGEMDHSGSSSGSHLHFSMISSTGNHSINEILPFAITNCVNGTSGCTPCSYPHVGGGQ